MSGGRRLVLVRHGRTAWNASGHAQGHADVGLDELGRAQAAAMAAYLRVLSPAAIWTSDLARARQTCAYLERATGLPAKADGRLREYDVGARQGMTMSEFAAAFPTEYDAWSRGEGIGRVPGAEVVADVEERMVPALRECLESLSPGETGIVVTHGASLKVGLAGLLGWPTGTGTTLSGMDNCHWAVVAEAGPGDRLRLESYNQPVGPDFASSTSVG